MEITKYVHSCLLININGKTILIDPGNYSYDSKALDINILEKLDYLLITHEHPDHMYLPFIQEILAKFPDLTIVSNSSVQGKLSAEGIKSTTDSVDIIKVQIVGHERVFGTEPPANMLFNIADTLTHPGDSLHFTSQTPILALPIQAPWCSLTQAVEFAISLKPQVILPIHDWHWNDVARTAFYKRLEEYFAKNGIKFLSLETGQKVVI